MRVFLQAKGMLQRHLGAEPREIRLPDNATLRDLLDHFHRHLSPSLPAYLWNAAERRFRGPVVITLGERVATNPTTPLADGQTIRLYKGFVGG